MKQTKRPHPVPLPKGEGGNNLSKTILEKITSLEELLKKKDDRPLTFKEACTYLGYAPSYLYKLTYKNVIPHYKPTGKMIFFSKNEVDEWIFKSSVERRVMSDDASTSLGMTKDDGSAPLTTKDPNQMEMELEEKTERSKQEKSETEVLIEFPLKSRRKK
ncbi:MAG: helix-turn-helix domain-containing protein [Ignavibacteria bacterium]|nr:helix-turn-helix domain-containing protein [Ignavibacteria bacterium]